ncbi:MAG TPA: hypothetical protein VG266_10040 [Candidatus Dormibacteraeota bacterium]|jgi:hypothetical protein|nr:hypothetical protein [Candidatus Dormibacteraeota bacterium]
MDPHASLRLRDGDREIEVSGSPGFVRQALDDLPSLLARLRGETGSARPTSISLPAPPEAVPDVVADVVSNGGSSLDDKVLAVIAASRRPISIADIRERLEGQVSGQQVRRILERAGERVVSNGGKPATYRLR